MNVLLVIGIFVAMIVYTLVWAFIIQFLTHRTSQRRLKRLYESHYTYHANMPEGYYGTDEDD